MVENLDKYLAQMVLWGQLAIVLDTGYKLKLLEYYFSFSYGDEVAKMEIYRICKICFDLFIEYSLKFNIGGYGDSYSESLKYDPTLSSLGHNENLESMDKFDLFVAFTKTDLEGGNTKIRSLFGTTFDTKK